LLPNLIVDSNPHMEVLPIQVKYTFEFLTHHFLKFGKSKIPSKFRPDTNMES
jgi:hypothetical protein